MIDQIPTTTILVGYNHRDAAEQQAFDGLAQKFSQQLDQPVIACALDDGERPLINAIGQALSGGAVRLVIVPLFLSPFEYRSNAITDAVAFASRRWPFLQFHLSPPITWEAWVEMVNVDPKGFRNPLGLAVILAVQDDIPEINSDYYKLARLVFEAHDFGWVEMAFVGENGRPFLPDMLLRMKRLGAESVIVVPWVLFAGTAVSEINKIVAGEMETAVVPHLGEQPMLLDLLSKQHETALLDRTLLPVSWEEIERQLTAELNTHDKGKFGQPAPDEDEYLALTAKINAILPPRYQNNLDAVSSAPMAAGELVFDDDGKVAWDEVFGFDDPDSPFCELALAGGPSHRGELLEAVAADECAKELGKYTAVVAEIERGIQMITKLPTVRSDVLGWVGVQCDRDEMAIWLVRAIIVENVMIRREGDVLYLPAGPHFTLKNEIKSIATVVAKTCHYWVEHQSRQQFSQAVRTS